jgi:NTP pyrophosphatase (non-canonical NTP hydrolase)
MNLRELQAEAWANKLAKGFNTTDVPLEFGLLVEEIGEAFSAWRKEGDLAGELADVAIFLVSIAEMTGVDLQAAVEDKLTVNAARAYRALPNGTQVKAAAS